MKDVAQFCAIRLPVELGHAAISHKRREHVAQVISSHNDWDSLYDITISPLLIYADSVGVVTDVHQRAHNNLVVHCHLQKYHHLSMLLFRNASHVCTPMR